MSSLFPQFYVIRPERKQTTTSGNVTYSIVPLIPADQLPEWLDIVGVPKTLHHHQASKMTSVGIVPRDAGFYSVQIMGSDPSVSQPPSFSWAEAAPFAHVPIMGGDEHDPSSSSSIHTPSNEIDHKERMKTHRDEYGPWPLPLSNLVPQAEERSVQYQGEDDMPTGYSPSTLPSIHLDAISSHDTVPTHSTSSTPLPDSREDPDHQDSSADSIPDDQAPPPPSKQQQPYRPPDRGYCHYWCTHGVCKWGPRCRFLHKMPETPEGFRSVKLTGYPRWYIDLMKRLDFSRGPEHASKLLYMKANTAPPNCRAKSGRKGEAAHPQAGSNAVLTPTEIEPARTFAAATCKVKNTVGTSHNPTWPSRERKNYHQHGPRKTHPGVVGLGDEGGKQGGSMMEQLTRSLGGVDLAGTDGDSHILQGSHGVSSGRLVEPEKSPLYQRRPPNRTRGPRDHILIAAIGDGEPVALKGSKTREEFVVEKVGGNGVEGRDHVPVVQSGRDEGGKMERSEEGDVNDMGNGKGMGKWKWKRELELERREGEKVAVEKVAKPDVGGVDLLTFSDSE